MDTRSARILRLRADYRNRQVRWGFFWALWCAVLWGAWYVPGEALYFEAPFVELGELGRNGYLISAIVISVLNAIFVLLALFVWIGALGKIRDFGATLRQPSMVKTYIPAGICGLLAIFGSFIAIAYVGAVFGAVAGLLYPLVGATVARLWYKEKVSGRAGLGILAIVIGAVAIFVPGLAAELTGAGEGALLGYLGGALAIFGWGFEGAFAGRVLDVSDPDVGITIRFAVEVATWLAVVVPLAFGVFGGELLMAFARTFTNPTNIVFLVMVGVTFGFCYASWYKSFPLIGVGRGQAVAGLYGPFAVVFLYMFTLEPPDINFIIGAVLATVGCFLLYTEQRTVLEVIRDVDVRVPQREMGGVR